MNVKDNKGFSLVELLVAIVIMAAFVIPTCSAFVLTARMNNKTDEMMQAQLAVSSAVETLMAKGITVEKDGQSITVVGLGESLAESEFCESADNERFSVEVYWNVSAPINDCYCNVTAISKDGSVEVSTSVRIAEIVNKGGQS